MTLSRNTLSLVNMNINSTEHPCSKMIIKILKLFLEVKLRHIPVSLQWSADRIIQFWHEVSRKLKPSYSKDLKIQTKKKSIPFFLEQTTSASTADFKRSYLHIWTHNVQFHYCFSSYEAVGSIQDQSL